MPCVDGVCQLPGAEARARVARADFTEERDVFVLDLTSAYPVDGLRGLTRSFTYDRSGGGVLIVEDSIDCEWPRAYESALITFGRWSMKGRDCIEIEGKDERVRVRVTVPGDCGFSVTAVPLKENGPEMTRIAIRPDRKIDRGVVRLVIE